MRPPLARRQANLAGMTAVALRTSTSLRKKKSKDRLKILIAEDDVRNSFVLTEMLGYLGYNTSRVTVVEDGQKCLDAIDAKHYDVLLLDIILPMVDGLAVATRVRQLKRQPYIVAVSAAVQPSDKQRCQEVGIGAYLSKPVIREKLEAVLSPLVKP